MELLERKNAKENWKLPKNVRQIGEPGQGIKILIEDYVYTFLHQVAETNLTCIKTAVLVGRVEKGQGIYVQGALEVDMGQDMKKWFTHDQWRDIFQEIHTWFEGMDVIGWYMANPGFPPVLSEEIKKIHGRNFSGDNRLFFQTDILDNEEVFYVCGEKGLAPVCGYYIYYEKNDRMQAYMSRRRGGAGIEREGIIRDRATARFRNVMQEKREQSSQKKVLAFLYTSCTFLVMVILVIGITLVNNYDRMSHMEHAIDNISESLAGARNTGSQEEVEEAVRLENQQALADQDGQAPDGEPETNDDEQADAEGEEAKTEEPDAPDDGISEPDGQDTSEESTEPDEEAPDSSENPEPVQEVMSQAVSQPERYVVNKGDTLLNICRTRYGTEDMLDKILELNELSDSDIIYVGEIILLP